MNTKVIVISGVVIGVFAFLKGRSSVTNEDDKTSDTYKDAEKEVNKKELTHSESWYSRTADILQTKFNSLYLNNEETKTVVFKLAELRNESDWLFLIAKFGKRSDVPIYWNEGLVRLLEYRLNGKSFDFYNKKLKKNTHVSDALLTVKKLFKHRGFEF